MKADKDAGCEEDWWRSPNPGIGIGCIGFRTPKGWKISLRMWVVEVWKRASRRTWSLLVYVSILVDFTCRDSGPTRRPGDTRGHWRRGGVHRARHGCHCRNGPRTREGPHEKDDRSSCRSKEGGIMEFLFGQLASSHHHHPRPLHLHAFTQKQRISYKASSHQERPNSVLAKTKHRVPLLSTMKQDVPSFPAIEVSCSVPAPRSADGQRGFVYIAQVCTHYRPILLVSCNSHVDPIYPTLLSRVIPGVEHHLNSPDNNPRGHMHQDFVCPCTCISEYEAATYTKCHSAYSFFLSWRHTSYYFASFF